MRINNWFDCLPGRIATSIAAVFVLTTVVPASAQMQIPNPLIRPRSLVSAAAPDKPVAAPAADAPAQRGLPPPPYPGAMPAVPLPGSAVSGDDATARDLNELRNRLSQFYVSAIVGKQAILRRTSSAATAPIAQNGAQQGGAGTPQAPVPGSPVPAAQGRSESMMMADGEQLDAVINSGALFAKVSNHDVIIYHVQDTQSASGKKQNNRRSVVFYGGVENSGGTMAPAIILERPDANFKRMISVETKARSASAPQQDTSNNNSAAAPIQQPLPLQ